MNSLRHDPDLSVIRRVMLVLALVVASAALADHRGHRLRAHQPLRSEKKGRERRDAHRGHRLRAHQPLRSEKKAANAATSDE
jgi:hypothetical protein